MAVPLDRHHLHAGSASYAAEVQRRVRNNAQIGFVILSVCAALATLFEFLRSAHRLPWMLGLDAGFVALAVASLLVMRRRPSATVGVTIVSVNLVGIALNAYHAAVGAEIALCVWMLTALLSTTSVTVHWGWRAQLAASWGALLGFVLMLPHREAELEWAAGAVYLVCVAGMGAFGAARIDGALRRDYELAATLAEREQRLQSYFDLSLVGIAVLAEDLGWIEINDALCRMLHYNREQLLARSWFDVLPAAERSAERTRLRSVARGEIGSLSRERTLTRRDGGPVRAIISVRALPGSGDPAPRLMLLVQDISHRWRLEEENRQARELAEAAARLSTNFIAGASHDFRTPLQAIFGLIDVVLDTDLTAEQRGFLDRARLAGDQLIMLVNDVLDFARMRSDQPCLHPREFVVRSWLAKALDPLEVLAQQKGLRLASELAGSIPERVVGDPDRLTQVVNNLVANAIKFTSEGEVRVRIESTGADHGSAVGLHVVVSDTGPGIADKDRETIFQPFARAASAADGTGLGLAICSRLAELMNGSVWVESRVGAGSQFHFVARLVTAPQPS